MCFHHTVQANVPLSYAIQAECVLQSDRYMGRRSPNGSSYGLFRLRIEVDLWTILPILPFLVAQIGHTMLLGVETRVFFERLAQSA